MKEKLLNLVYTLIGEASSGIHDAEMNIFYKKENCIENKQEIDDNLLKLDIASELIILLMKTEDDFEKSLHDYIDHQIDLYSKELLSKDQISKMILNTRKKVLDFFVINFYK